MHEQPLGRNRPLWDIAVITGLADNRVAYYNRVHRACLDGVGAQASFELLMDQHPDRPEAKTAIPGGARKSLSIQEHVAGLFEAMTMQAIDNITHTPNRIAAATRLWRRSLDSNKGLGAAAAPEYTIQ